MPFERLVTLGPITIDLIDGADPDLVISFASVGHDPTRPPSPEFVGTATGRGGVQPPRRALFVMDERRSWANDPAFAPALQAALASVTHRAPVARIATIGLSMGGFAALAAAKILPVDVVLAFGPQWSVDPVLMPTETRWQSWTKRLPSPLRWPHAPLPQSAWACLFHGTADDQAQALAFPVQPGTDHLLFPGLGHADLVPHLKARGLLSGLIEAALTKDRRRLLRIASSAGGIRRRT